MTEEKIIVSGVVETINATETIEQETEQIVQEETVESVGVEPAEIFAVEVREAFAATGDTNDMSVHRNLHGRDDPDQHQISAISGLRSELNALNTVKTPHTLYSDKVNIANYYAWSDGAHDDYGYFVSLVPHTTTIKKCNDSDIFGVTVDDAGFIGNQNATVLRDSSYALVVTSGLVNVRCESTVVDGDCVVSNTRGFATKTDSGCGYKVIAIENKDGVNYASISLGVQACTTDLIGKKIHHLDDRINDAEINIASAMNVANDAYNKAIETDSSNKEMSAKVDSALGVIDVVVSDVEDLGTQVSNATLISALAKAIAESAATSAESMRNDAVDKANEALAETSELRKELDAKVTEIDAELDNTTLELEATKEGFNATINDLKLQTEGKLADFKQEVEDNYATTTQLAAVKTENSDAVAALKQEVSDTYATMESVTFLQTETSDALAGFKQEVSETYATQEMLTSLETETSKTLTDYKQEVTNTYATQEMASKIETDTTKTLTDYKQEVADTYATQEMVTKLETDTSKALTDYKQEVNDAYATQTSLTSLRTDTNIAIAASEEKAAETYASKSDLTSFESDTNVAIARIEQKADANGAYIQSTIANLDKYSVGPYSQAYGFALEQARAVLEEGMVYVPTPHGDKDTHDEIYTYTETDASGNEVVKNYPDDDGYQFTKGYIYTWSGETWVESVGKVVSFGTAPKGSAYALWYKNGGDNSDGYEPYTLYKFKSYTTKNEDGTDATKEEWFPVATLQGNSSSRAVSQIRQDANSIETSVTTIDGKYAGTKTWVDNNKSAIEETVKWKGDNATSIAAFMQEAGENFASTSQVAKVVDKDGNVNAASIVAAVNESGSSVVIDADHINLNGAVTANNNVTIGTDGTITAINADITGKITATSGKFTGEIHAQSGDIGGVLIGDFATKNNVESAKTEAISSAVNEIKDIGYQTSSQVTTITQNEINTATIRANQVDVTDLNAFGATIGGWNIDENVLYASNGAVGIYSGDTKLLKYDYPLRFYAGEHKNSEVWQETMVYGEPIWLQTSTVHTNEIDGKRVYYAADSATMYENPPVYNMSAMKYEFEGDGYYATIMDGYRGSVVIGEDEESHRPITVRCLYYMDDPTGQTYCVASSISTVHYSLAPESSIISTRYYGMPTYQYAVQEDGKLYANKATIRGRVDMTTGSIGGFNIENRSIKTKNLTIEVEGDNSGRIILYNENASHPDVEIRPQGIYAKEYSGHTLSVDKVDTKVCNAGEITVSKLSGNGNAAFELNYRATTTIYNAEVTYVTDDIYGIKVSLDSVLKYDKVFNITYKSGASGVWNFISVLIKGGTDKTIYPIAVFGGVKYIGFADGDTYTTTMQFTQSSDGEDIGITGNLLPKGYYNLGGNDNKWLGIYAETVRASSNMYINDVAVSASDKNKKNTIETMSDKYTELFDCLRPVTYKYNNGQSNRIHTGLIANEVKDAMDNVGLSDKEFAAYCSWEDDDGNETCGLRYGEFISLCIDQIQKLKKRVEELEGKLNTT